MVGYLGGVADTAKEDGVEPLQCVEGVVRHHLTTLEVAVAAPVEHVKLDTEAVGVRRSLGDAHCLLGNLGSDSVAGDHR